MRWWSRNRTDAADQAEVDAIVETWHRCCESIGLTNDVDTVTGVTHVVPRVEYVRLGPPTVLTVRLTPGMLPDDFTGQARRIARSMGAQSLRVEPRGYSHVLVTLLAQDPLATVLSLPVGPLSGPVILGSDEHGQDVLVPDLPHTLIVGATGSGKSMAAYSLISQSLDRGVQVSGVDPSNTTLRPVPGSVCGLGDLTAVDDYLTRQVEELDRRMSLLPVDSDILPVSSRNPRILVCLDEYPALLRAVDSVDKKLATRVRGNVSRLLFEGRKVHMSVLIMAQRPDAQILGGAERAQAGLRIAFRLDGADAVKMVIPDAVDQAAEHASAPPGVALLASPGRPPTRIRSPFLAYSDYVSRVAPLRGAA